MGLEPMSKVATHHLQHGQRVVVCCGPGHLSMKNNC